MVRPVCVGCVGPVCAYAMFPSSTWDLLELMRFLSFPGPQMRPCLQVLAVVVEVAITPWSGRAPVPRRCLKLCVKRIQRQPWQPRGLAHRERPCSSLT